MRQLACSVVLSACLTACATSSLNPDAAVMVETLDTSADTWLEEALVPAAAVAFIDNGEVAFTRIYGEKRAGIPSTDDTVFNVASMAKPVTAELILRLVARGELGLDSPMGYYWADPDIAEDPWLHLLTPRVALTHETGFANWRSMTDGVLQFQFEPGTRPGYSGEGYNYLGRFVEAKTGTDFEVLVQQEVFGPLGLTQSTFTQTVWLDDAVTPPHDQDGKPLPLQVSDNWSGADDLHTTVGDYALFLASVIRGDAMTDALFELKTKPHRDQFGANCPLRPDACPHRGGFSAGWAAFEYDEGTIVFQGGGDAGIRTMAFFDPATRDGMVILTNSANGSGVIAQVAGLSDVPEGFKAFLRMQAGME